MAWLPIAAAAVSIFSTLTAKKPSAPDAPPPPAAPLAPPTLMDPQIDAAGAMQKQRAAAAGGIMANIGTSPSGVTGPASTTGKTLLGS